MNKRTLPGIVTILLLLLVCGLLIRRVVWQPTPSAPTAQGRSTFTPTRPALPSLVPTVRSATAVRTATATTVSGTPTASPTRTGGQPATPTLARGLVVPTTSPAPPTVTPVRGLLTSVEDMVQAARDGVHGVPYRISITEAEITEQIALYLASNQDLAFSDVHVALQPGQAVITGKARVINFNIGFRAVTTVIVRNGTPYLKVLSLDVLGGLVPGFVKDRLIQMIEQNTDLSLVHGLPVTIERVEIASGKAIVEGTLL